MNIQLSKTHSINTSGFWGQGIIQKSKSGFPCSAALAAQYERDYGHVFAVVRHPEHGLIAVTSGEWKASGLPEVIGFPTE